MELLKKNKKKLSFIKIVILILFAYSIVDAVENLDAFLKGFYNVTGLKL